MWFQWIRVLRIRRCLTSISLFHFGCYNKTLLNALIPTVFKCLHMCLFKEMHETFCYLMQFNANYKTNAEFHKIEHRFRFVLFVLFLPYLYVKMIFDVRKTFKRKYGVYFHLESTVTWCRFFALFIYLFNLYLNKYILSRGYSSFFLLIQDLFSSSDMKINISWVTVATSEIW
jgi:hypothetical protein